MSGSGNATATANQTNPTAANDTSKVSENQETQSIYPQAQSTAQNMSQSSTDSETQAPLLNQSQVETPSYGPKANLEEGLKPRITVIGVGGAGCNAINNMIKSELVGVDFIVANTDAQALEQSTAETKIQLGLEATHGLGAGSHPEMGRASAEESIHDVLKRVGGSHMLFVTAGMGGGTGTGAAPVIAQSAREHGILTVGVVTKPFHFEGAKRMRVAEAGIEELQKYVDTLIVIPNQNLFRVANEKTTFVDAFKMADEVLYSGVRSVTDLMMKPGLINLDFADVKAVMGEMMGKAMMGTGEAEGETRAIDAAEAAISSPLLDDVSMKGAKAVLINITGGMDMTLFEADEAANRIREEVDPNAHIIFGSTFDENLKGKIRVSCVATGIDAHSVVAASVSQSSSSRQDRSTSDVTAGEGNTASDNTKKEFELTPSAGEKESATSPHIHSVQEELGVSFDEDGNVTEAESTYDIYSSLREEIDPNKTNTGTKPHSFSEDLATQNLNATASDEAENRSNVHSQETMMSEYTHPHHSSVNKHESPVQEDTSGESVGFFSRLMGRKKAKPRVSETPKKPISTSQQSTRKPSEPLTRAESEDLDVPAFLRRKDRH